MKLHHNIKHSYFIYPDESSVKGSTRLFADLLDRMAEKEKIAVCRYIARSYSMPRLVALIPERDSKSICGFHMITLPFADDLRDFKKPEKPAETSDEQVSKALEIIENLKVPSGFTASSFENPVIKRHYSLLQAHALGREMDEFKDSTMPDADAIDAKIGSLARDFKLLTGLKDQEPGSKVAPKSAPVKKRKAKDDTDADADADNDNDANGAGNLVQAAFEKGKLKSLTVAQLKDFLSANGIKAKKLKGEIVEQVTEFLSQK